MQYTDVEKQAIASLIIRILEEKNEVDEQNKYYLLDLLQFIGMNEAGIKTIKGALTTDESVAAILQMPHDKKIDFFNIILRLAKNIADKKYILEYTSEKIAALFLIIKTGCFEEILANDISKINFELYKTFSDMRTHYWKIALKKR